MSITAFPSDSETSATPTTDDFDDAGRGTTWPGFDWPAEPIRVLPPARAELFKLRGLIVLGTISMLLLMTWLLSPGRFGDPLVYLGLTLAVGLRAICRLFEWYNYWSITVPPEQKPKRPWKVDVLTTACPGEPAGMILRTLNAMAAITYPHTSYLCDEGNDPYLKRVCEKLGIVHVTRTDNNHAKAGNINNALRQATGEIAVVLDPDHEPAPYFLDRTIGYFEDPGVGFVQSVQAYRNQDQSFVARGAAEQSYHFYGPHMMGMHGRGTTQAIGANCVFRRAALDSIGGHAPGLAEDMHTSMRLYAAGWKSVYTPEILTRGLVPSTLPAYFKQQLKWSCGVFDLLFQEYPRLASKFTLSQKIHFLFCPFFFLRGLIGLMEMLVPMACLTFGFIAWRATIPQILLWFIPVLGFSALIHLRVQRWLLEPHERGLHLAGGLLSIATWWVYLAGFICAVFRIKVPYIPTPKEGEATNAIGIAIPNLVVAGILITAAALGIYLDSSPPALFMCGIALVNAFALVCISVAAQQLMVHGITVRLLSATKTFLPLKLACAAAAGSYRALINRVREGSLVPAVFVMAMICAYLGLLPRSHAAGIDGTNQREVRDVGGFYTGIALTGADPVAACLASEKSLDFKFRVVSFDQRWNPAGEFPMSAMQQLRRSGATPFMNWLPTADGTDFFTDGLPVTPQNILKAICGGKYDDYINHWAVHVRTFGEPVFICFAPQQDNPKMPWSPAPDGTPEGSDTTIDFIEAYKHISILFREAGASNVAWVWNPYKLDATENPPELAYVNWIGIPASNADPKQSFAQQYDPVRPQLIKWNLPVMIDALQPTGDEAGAQWARAAMSAAAGKYPEIKAVVLKNPADPLPRGSIDSETAATNRPVDDAGWAGVARETLKTGPLPTGVARAAESTGPLWFDLHRAPNLSRCVTGSAGHFSLLVDGSPFYVKGVVYNAGHDWRDSELPLTHRQLNQDFAAIAAMGGNTIRRYGTNFSDRNIFNAAADNHLKVMYGFWLPQDINYLTDDQKMKKCEDEIERTVRTYRNHRGLLGWSLGNEVWGLLKHKYAQPYLTQVRHGEVQFVEKMARRIKELDPAHPVFCAQESFDVSGAIGDYAAGAPSIDVMCVNSYYEQEIAHLDQAVTRVDPNRPYLVSEFGPDGYWDDKYNHRDAQNGLMESTAMYKAWQYADRWREYVQRNKGRDVGGIAYCWSDRFEGTATWFGMSDLDGHRKPACAALASAWNDPNPDKYGTFEYSGPKILNLVYPTSPVKPHTPFEVKAAVQTLNGDRVSYNWTVTGPGFTTDVGSVHPIEAGDTATIELPDTPGWYRVQVKVTGREGMDEANVPVKVPSPDGRESGS